MNTSSVGGPVVVTANAVYASGPRSGSVLTDTEFAVTRMDQNGDNETEILVASDQLYAFTASATAAFIQSSPDFQSYEIWRISDGEPTAEFVLDVGQQNMGWAIHDEGRLLVQDNDGASIIALDLDTLMFESLLEPPDPAVVLWSAAEYVFAGTDAALLATRKDDLVFEQVDDSGSVWFIAGDESNIFWLTAGDGTRLWTSPILGTGATNIFLADDLGGIESIAIADDYVYLVGGLVPGYDEAHSGSVWRLARP